MDTSFSFLPKAELMCSLSKAQLEAGRHKILYGSDFPNLIFPREEEIDHLLGLDLSREFYDRVFQQNALRLIEQCGMA